MKEKNIVNLEQLVNLYQVYILQANEKRNINNMMMHDDSGPGDPDYHCDTHDNYPTMIVRKRTRNGSN